MRETTDDTEAPPGWEPLDFVFPAGPRPRFLSDDPQGGRLQVRYFRRQEDRALVARVWFGPGSEGPPGHAHGGAISAVLDEAMGGAAWLAGHPVVCARLTISFLQMVPLHCELFLETRIEGVRGRKVTTRASLAGGDGVRYAEGEGLYVVLGPDRQHLLHSGNGPVSEPPQA